MGIPFRKRDFLIDCVLNFEGQVRVLPEHITEAHEAVVDEIDRLKSQIERLEIVKKKLPTKNRVA